MIEGVIFYWFSWIFWVLITFFMKKSRRRTYLSFWGLLSIVCSNIYVKFYIFDIHVTLIIVWFGSFILLLTRETILYHFFASFTCMIGYTSILIWEHQAPVWVFGPRLIILSVISMLLVTFVATDFFNQCTIALIGMCTGEVLFNILLGNYYIQDVIGKMAFFDHLYTTLFLLIIVHSYRVVKQWLMNNGYVYQTSDRVHPVHRMVKRL
ncbi:MAG TPA: hypothetical protein VF095_02555 [Bacillota bacterium]